MRFGSVCSGIEAASVAWHPLGWRAAFVSEIEAFPCAVLAHHYPTVPNHGDMTRFEEWPDAALDVLVGGTPCQSFSVAGLRGGLADPRGNLMLTFGAIARRYRPTWLVWENVPGVLSSNGGRDFGTFLGMLAELGYGFAYRVLDAQFFGVAQRRRRVFVVGCLGDWRRAAAVLFERDSLSGNPAPSREARQDAAGSTGDGIARCLTTGEAKRQDWETCNFVAHSLRGEGFDASEDGTGRGTPLVPVSVALRGRDGGATAELGDEVAFTLRASEGGGDKPHVLAHAFDARQSDVIQYGDKTGQLDTDGGSIGVLAFDTTQVTSAANRSNPKPGDPCHPLAAGAHAPAIASPMAVRRLTPVECARLQGFPPITYRARIEACCSGHPANAAPAVAKNLKSPSDVSHASADETLRSASSVVTPSSTGLGSRDEPVALTVLIDYGREEVRLLRAGRLLWSASSAGAKNSSPLPIPVASFVRLVARISSEPGRGTATSKSVSTTPSSGGAFAKLSLNEITEIAGDAERLSSLVTTMSTTSGAGPSSLNSDSTWQIWCSCVAAVIAGSTPAPMPSGSSFVLSVEVEREYLDITYRGKPAADGPKYKALGNSMAVPVMAWIGERIAMVDALKSERVA